MKDRYTIKKIYKKTIYKDVWLWGHIQLRVRERVNEFWKFFLERLSLNENKLLKVNSFDRVVFDLESLIIKQVYAMATYDGLYSKSKDKEKIDLKKEDEKLDNLIDICFEYPELFISMLSSDKKKLDSYYQKHEVMIKRNDEMSGKKLSPENERMYQEILKIQDELYSEYGSGGGHKTTLTKAIGVYNTRKKKKWLPQKLKSIHTSISKLKNEGRL